MEALGLHLVLTDLELAESGSPQICILNYILVNLLGLALGTIVLEEGRQT